MTEKPTITRIDHNDPLSRAALEAERRLFDRCGLAYQAHFVELGEHDLRVRVLEAGQGPPVLLVPGGVGDAWPLALLMAGLPGYRMIAINRPGSGLSDGIDHRQVDVRRLAVDTLLSVSKALGLERAPIICNSMGGLWSFWYTLEHPERVTRMAQMGCPALLLETSAPFFMRLLGVPGINRFIAPLMQPQSAEKAYEGLRFQGSRQEDIERLPEEGAEAVYHFYHLPTYLESWKTLISAVATLTGARPQYRLTAAQLRRVQQPVLFLWGDNDPFGNLEVGRRAVSILPDASLYEMRSGHLPFMDRPQETARRIGEFLAGDDSAGPQPDYESWVQPAVQANPAR